MGKLDLIKGQPVYLADKSKKRKKPHEQGQGENTTERVEKLKKPRKSNMSWRALGSNAFVDPLTSTIPTIPAPLPAVDATTVAGGSKGPGPSGPLRPVKKAKISTPSTLPSTGGSLCPLCGGLKHRLRDCLVPKGGIEK